MDITNPISSKIDLMGRHQHAPSEFAGDAFATTMPRQTAAAAPEKTIPQSQMREANGNNAGADLSAAVTRMNDYVQSIQRTLNFSVDDDTGRTVVKVIDTSTKEVIRQIPAEDVLKMLKHFKTDANGESKNSTGIFVQEQA